MAVYKCKECGGKVSTLASKCPHCGAPTPPPDPDQPVARKSKSNDFTALALVLVLAGILVATCSQKSTSTTANENTNKACAVDDLTCLGNERITSASVYCASEVEKLAKHQVKWTDGTLELKFSHFRWKDQPTGVITFIGDKALFQNGFGAFTPVTYECDLAPDGKTVIDVRAHEGRIR